MHLNFWSKFPSLLHKTEYEAASQVSVRDRWLPLCKMIVILLWLVMTHWHIRILCLFHVHHYTAHQLVCLIFSQDGMKISSLSLHLSVSLHPDTLVSWANVLWYHHLLPHILTGLSPNRRCRYYRQVSVCMYVHMWIQYKSMWEDLNPCCKFAWLKCEMYLN